MNNHFISRRYILSSDTPMGKSDKLAKTFNDVINLSLGDPDLITHDLIINDAFADASNGHTKYTDFRGDSELISSIVSMYKEDFGLNINDDEIFISTSACHAMYLVLEAVLNDGEEVIIHAPYFTPYPNQITLARGIPVILNTYEDENFDINMERLEGLITDKTKAIIVNTPNNPVGKCFSDETLEQIYNLANRYNILIIADDIYGAFSYKRPFSPIMKNEKYREKVITLNSFSKNYVMTGWRVGNIIANSEIIKIIQQINENVVFTTPSISQRAAIAAIKYRHIIQPSIVKEYRSRVFYAASRINQINNLSTLDPEGTFYLFVNIQKTGLTSQEIADIILKEAHILVLPGNAFGDCGEGYIRIACTVNLKKLEEAFDRLEKLAIFK